MRIYLEHIDITRTASRNVARKIAINEGDALDIYVANLKFATFNLWHPRDADARLQVGGVLGFVELKDRFHNDELLAEFFELVSQSKLYLDAGQVGTFNMRRTTSHPFCKSPLAPAHIDELPTHRPRATVPY